VGVDIISGGTEKQDLRIANPGPYRARKSIALIERGVYSRIYPLGGAIPHGKIRQK
jgi:hypothetical protein